jgi:hypothetical protein
LRNLPAPRGDEPFCQIDVLDAHHIRVKGEVQAPSAQAGHWHRLCINLCDEQRVVLVLSCLRHKPHGDLGWRLGCCLGFLDAEPNYEQAQQNHP